MIIYWVVLHSRKRRKPQIVEATTSRNVCGGVYPTNPTIQTEMLDSFHCLLTLKGIELQCPQAHKPKPQTNLTTMTFFQVEKSLTAAL